jgi:endonuclease/exonuclease/phosphatase family metal-dependent hydrolase
MLEGDTPAIFAGDTNFREKEKAGFEKEIAKAIGSEEMRLFDLFVEVGEPSHLRFTWDTRTNTNKVKELPPRFRPRARFDQVLFTRPFQANAMRLLGRERLGHAVFPSDHYGIYGELRF